MAISKEQPMRPAEIALVDTVNELSGAIASVDTLSAQVTALESRIAAFETSTNARVTAVEGDMDTLESSMTTLETNTNARVTAVEGDIGDLTNSVEALDNSLGELARKDSVALDALDISGSIRNTTAITVNGAYAFDVQLDVPTGYQLISVKSIAISGTQNTQLVLRRFVIGDSDVNVTFKNVGTTQIDIDAISCIVHVFAIKQNFS